MLLLSKSQPSSVVVTVSELTTEPTSLFLFVFTHVQSLEEVSGEFENLSLSPDRYDKFLIDLPFPYSGQYKYQVYQPSNLKLLEEGMARIELDASPTDEFENTFTFNIYE
jgi:hypothetical protein